jgi:hypothetical protein
MNISGTYLLSSAMFTSRPTSIPAQIKASVYVTTVFIFSPSVRNGNLKIPVYLLKQKQGYAIKKYTWI